MTNHDLIQANIAKQKQISLLPNSPENELEKCLLSLEASNLFLQNTQERVNRHTKNLECCSKADYTTIFNWLNDAKAKLLVWKEMVADDKKKVDKARAKLKLTENDPKQLSLAF